MEEKRKISFVIPAYNCASTLEGCVSQIRRVADYSDVSFEIILVNDGSTDGTAELCDRLGDVVIHQKNSGASAARNTGIDHAGGKYIVFVDSDDTIDPEAFARVLPMLDEHPSVDVVSFGICFDYHQNGKLYRTDALVPPVTGMLSQEECLSQLVSLYRTNTLSAVWSKIIRRSLLADEALRFRTELFLFEDLEFVLRLLSVSENWAFSQEPVYHYYLEEQADHAGGRTKRMESLIPLMDTLEASLKGLGPSWEEQETQVLLDIHLVLMSQKVGASDRRTVRRLCEEFACWVDEHGLLPRIAENPQAMRFYKRNVGAILYQRTLTQVRHAAAVRIKSVIGDYRKWHIRK